MNTDKLIAALCYFSIFFAGFILPIVVYILVENPAVKKHALHALISHIIPVATIVFIVIPFFFMWSVEVFAALIILVFILLAIINIGIVIWNIVKGIQVLAHDQF
ncbi:DUF4870 domain-containing protein [Bacillus sp. REN16]|uniref:DUF4870 domain-containing protein n=1 Tax=Bacillus sp. REN16 TaxID=2887296 RepID=UPI001E3A71AE|nr:DUF4870 domain-containing protein [Bacillus sp. REN16]MCC3356002.1 DUF4870 domain-containing protein [Bacillus sp. REN16]